MYLPTQVVFHYMQPVEERNELSAWISAGRHWRQLNVIFNEIVQIETICSTKHELLQGDAFLQLKQLADKESGSIW